MKKIGIVFTMLFVSSNLWSQDVAQPTTQSTFQTYLQKVVFINDIGLLHLILYALALVLLIVVVWLTMSKIKIRKVRRDQKTLQTQKVELMTANSRLEDQVVLLNKQLSDLKTQMEKTSNQIADQKFTGQKLDSRIKELETDVQRKDAKIQELINKTKQNLLPESQRMLDDIEINLVKLEKLKRLNNIDIISEDEYQESRQKLLGELINHK